ncbi:MAG TPA: DUF1501 domain-containing protein [Patescibacteria group bacterium]|nr:DUF1501 domain-containing protein [Patescibacteria group bacterium]
MPMARRRFLELAGAALGATVLPLGGRSWALAAEAPVTRRLVVVMLRGAVDGLNVVAPYGDPLYAPLRPNIGLAAPGSAEGLLDLDGHFGLHPALAAVMPLWQSRRLAFVHACGSPDPSRSHFDAQDYMESATPGVRTTADGWMNRLVGVLPAPHAPTQAISLGATRPRILGGAQPTSNLSLGPNAGKPMPVDRPAVASAFAGLYGGSDALSRAYQDGQMARQELSADMQAEQAAADNGAVNAKGFPAIAARLANLLSRDDHIQLAFADLGGWDTHVNQGAAKGQLAAHLQPLGEGLAALAQGLGPQLDGTVVLVMSEFGRTARENGNKGTDHGHGNVMWVLGGQVAGGRIHGAWPGLAPDALYQGRDLAVTTDFRRVIAAALKHHLGLGDRQIATVLPPSPPFDGALPGLFLG